ncbi:MAG: S8 family serine peptidase, partial [Chitinophagales bacterium]
GVDQYHHINIPLSQLEPFLDEPAIIAVENADIPVVPLADTAIIKNNILPIHQGAAPLSQAYTGKDVIVGIVDFGIWFEHEDFIKPNGQTRIKYIWDQRVSNVNSPAPYNYGQQWNQVDIDQGNCTHFEQPVGTNGHGTTVSGIAAGNGRATGRFKGMAPESDLIVVAFNFEATFLSRLIDGIDYIFKKADAMGKPCVINGSLGTYFGSRDGTDMASKIVDGLLEERCGRAVVMANGNAGGFNYHLGYEVTADTAFTWYSYTNVLNNVSIQLWSDTADFDSVYFQISADDPGAGSAPATLAATDFFNIKQDFNLEPGNLTETISENLVGVGNVVIRAELKEDGYYYLDFNIAASNSSHYWRLSTTGTGSFDSWGSQVLIGNSNIVQNVPSVNDMPEIVNYKFPDNQKSMVSSIQASDKVISVGNYANRTDYLDVDSNLVITGEAAFVNQINPTSSLGPTRDGRTKPDISATGSTTIATGNQAQINISLGNSDRQKVAIGGKHFRNGGTSMASPVVAGFAALFFEKNPDACFREVKDVIINSAKQDTYTGNQLPDNTWGYGKLNAFEAIQLNYTYGCKDTSALNYQAGLDYDDGSCIPKVYGCTDPFAINYDEDANTDNDSCFYQPDPNDTTNISIAGQNALSIKVFPNPVSGDQELMLKFEGKANFPLNFQLMDLTGKIVLKRILQNELNRISLKKAALQNALYFYSINDGQQLIHQGKISVQ